MSGFWFDAYHTLEKTFGGLPLTITAHRRIADDFQCVSASYKGNTTVIDKSIRTPFGLNMILGNNIAGRPFLVVASSMGDDRIGIFGEGYTTLPSVSRD